MRRFRGTGPKHPLLPDIGPHARRRAGRLAGLLALVAVCIGLAVVLVGPLRTAVSNRVAWAMIENRDAWIERIARAEQLLDRDPAAAAARFEVLDAEIPVENNRYALDRERERVLIGLGRANAHLDRKGRALDAFARAVRFDPRNVDSRFELAAAAARFLEPELARSHLDTLLTIHPSHQRAVEMRLSMDFEDGRFGRVVEQFETYLDAVRFQPIRFEAGTGGNPAQVPVDGRMHTVRWTPDPGQRSDSVLTIRVTSPRLRVVAASWTPQPGPGHPADSVVLPVPSAGTDEPIRVDTSLARVHHVTLRVASRIPLSPDALRQVEIAYRNLLAERRFEEQRSRVFILVPPARDEGEAA